MPADILTTDTLFPELNGGESTDQKFELVTDYLWLLREQLTYALTNLGIANFNQTQLGKLSGIIAEPLKVVLAEQETQFTEFGVELGLISGRLTKVANTVGDEESGLVQQMAAFQLQADGFTQSFTAIGKVLNGEDGESGLVKDVADVAGNYISKSAVTQTAEGFELAVTTAKRNTDGDIVYDKDGAEVEVSAITFNADGMTIKDSMDNKKFEFKTKEGSLWIQGTIEGSDIYGSSLYTCKKGAKSTDGAYMVLDDNGLISMNKGVKNGIAVESNTILDGISEIGFYRKGFQMARMGTSLSNLYLETAQPGTYTDGFGERFDFTKPWINFRVPANVTSYKAADIRLSAEYNSDASLIKMSAVTIEMTAPNLTVDSTYTQIDATAELALRLNPGTNSPVGLRLVGTSVEIYAQGGFWVNGTRID